MKFKEIHSKEIDILFNIIINFHKDLNFKKEDIISTSRKQPLPSLRRIAVNILYDVYKDKFIMDDISESIGRKRVTVSHHIKIHLNHCSLYKDYKEKFEVIKKEFLKELEK